MRDLQHQFGACASLRARTEGHGSQSLDALNLRLRFGEGDPLLAEQKCSVWVDPQNGPGLTKGWKPDPPRAAKLQVRSELNWRRAGGKRVPLGKPFVLLEFDPTSELRATQNFYAKCVELLKKLIAIPNPQSGDDKALKQFLERISNSAIGELRGVGTARLDVIRKRIGEQAGQVKGLAATDDAALVPGWVLRHMAALTQMAWIAFGGAALNQLADNGGEAEDKATYERLPQLDPEATHAGLRAWHLPQCGAGVGARPGSARARRPATRCTSRSWTTNSRVATKVPTGSPRSLSVPAA